MPKFGKKSNTSQDIPTAALPDIIFMLLFFFMVTTVLRETDIMVKQKLPKAAQLTKLERKSLVSYIYIGEPKQSSLFGKEPKGELTVVISEKKINKNLSEKLTESDINIIKKMINKLSTKEITEILSQTTNVPKKEIYNYCLELKNEK